MIFDPFYINFSGKKAQKNPILALRCQYSTIFDDQVEIDTKLISFPNSSQFFNKSQYQEKIKEWIQEVMQISGNYIFPQHLSAFFSYSNITENGEIIHDSNLKLFPTHVLELEKVLSKESYLDAQTVFSTPIRNRKIPILQFISPMPRWSGWIFPIAPRPELFSDFSTFSSSLNQWYNICSNLVISYFQKYRSIKSQVSQTFTQPGPEISNFSFQENMSPSLSNLSSEEIIDNKKTSVSQSSSLSGLPPLESVDSELTPSSSNAVLSQSTFDIDVHGTVSEKEHETISEKEHETVSEVPINPQPTPSPFKPFLFKPEFISNYKTPSNFKFSMDVFSDLGLKRVIPKPPQEAQQIPEKKYRKFEEFEGIPVNLESTRNFFSMSKDISKQSWSLYFEYFGLPVVQNGIHNGFNAPLIFSPQISLFSLSGEMPSQITIATFLELKPEYLEPYQKSQVLHWLIESLKPRSKSFWIYPFTNFKIFFHLLLICKEFSPNTPEIIDPEIKYIRNIQQLQVNEIHKETPNHSFIHFLQYLLEFHNYIFLLHFAHVLEILLDSQRTKKSIDAIKKKIIPSISNLLIPLLKNVNQPNSLDKAIVQIMNNPAQLKPEISAIIGSIIVVVLKYPDNIDATQFINSIQPASISFIHKLALSNPSYFHKFTYYVLTSKTICSKFFSELSQFNDHNLIYGFSQSDISFLHSLFSFRFDLVEYPLLKTTKWIAYIVCQLNSNPSFASQLFLRNFLRYITNFRFQSHTMKNTQIKAWQLFVPKLVGMVAANIEYIQQLLQMTPKYQKGKENKVEEIKAKLAHLKSISQTTGDEEINNAQISGKRISYKYHILSQMLRYSLQGLASLMAENQTSDVFVNFPLTVYLKSDDEKVQSAAWSIIENMILMHISKVPVLLANEAFRNSIITSLKSSYRPLRVSLRIINIISLLVKMTTEPEKQDVKVGLIFVIQSPPAELYEVLKVLNEAEFRVWKEWKRINASSKLWTIARKSVIVLRFQKIMDLRPAVARFVKSTVSLSGPQVSGLPQIEQSPLKSTEATPFASPSRSP